MPTPTPRPNLPSLTAIAASNGALGVLALHALSLHDCIAALDARLAAVEARDADMIARAHADSQRWHAMMVESAEAQAAAERLVKERDAEIRRLAEQSAENRKARDEAESRLAALVPAHDKAMADLAVLTAEHERLKAAHETHTEWPVVRAAIDALAQSTNARERTDRICDLRVKIEAYATTRHAAETAATIAAGKEIDALRAKLADETQRRVNAESHRDVAVAEMGKFKADLARLTKPGPASDEELRSVWCKAHREAMSAAGQHYHALTAAERALYTYGLAHARAEQAVLPTCRLTIEDDDDGYKAICEDGVGIAKSRSTTACKRIVAALSAAEHRRESERDAVADFIYGHAKRLGEQSGADGDELMVEIHDVLNHLRADENGEVFDGRAERATPTPASGPTDEEIARAIHVAIFGVPVPSKTEHDRLAAAITTVVRPLLVAAESRAQRAEQERGALVAALAEWCLRHGAALKPLGADTFGEGMREAKAQIAAIVRDKTDAAPPPERGEVRTIPVIAEDVIECAEAWEPAVCLLGNVRADEVARLARYAAAACAADVLRGKEPAPAVDAGRLAEAYVDSAAPGYGGVPFKSCDDGVQRRTVEAMRRALATVGAGLTVAPVVWSDEAEWSDATMGRLRLRAFATGKWMVRTVGGVTVEAGREIDLASAKAAAVAFAASINGATPVVTLTAERLADAIEKCPFWIATGELRPDGTHESMHEDDAADEILRHLGPVAPPVAPEAEPPAVPREVVTVEEIVAAWDSIACNAPTSSLPSDAVRAAVERFVGSVIAGGG